MSEKIMTSADAIDKEIRNDLRNGKKVETTNRYDSVVNAIVEKAKERKCVITATQRRM